MGSARTLTDPNFWTVKVDHEFSERDRINGRYMQSLETWRGANLAPFSGRTSQNQGRNVMFSYTHIFSPRVMNEIRFGYNRGLNSSLQEGAFGECFEPCEEIDYVNDVFHLQNIGGGPITFGLPIFRAQGFTQIGVVGNNSTSFLNETYQISDNLIMNYGAHSLKAGFDFRDQGFDGIFSPVSRGEFIFNGRFSGHSAADLLLGVASRASSASGVAGGIVSSNSYQFYFQDDWRVNPKLTLNLGIRYEYHAPYTEENGRLKRFDHGAPLGTCFGLEDPCAPGEILAFGPDEGVTDPDKNNWGPRLGLAYSPFGDNKTVIRAAYGIFYSRLEGAEVILNLQLPPNLTRFALFPNSPNDLETTNLGNLFPPSPAEVEPPFVTGPDWPLGPIGVFSPSKHFPDFTLNHWQLTVQREVIRNLLIEVGYVGTHGYNGQGMINGNQARQPDCGFTPGGCTNAELNASPIPTRKPYPQLGNFMRYIERTAHNTYHAGTLRLERRFEKGLSFVTAYTYAKTLDTYGNLNDTTNFYSQNTYDKDADKGLASFHAKHRFTTGYIWELPFGRSRRWGSDMHAVLDGVLGGWQLSGITTFQTGNPLRILLRRDFSNTGSFPFTSRPDLGAPLQQFDPRADNLRYFNADAFKDPELGTFGDSGRGIFTGPGINNWDIAITKSFSITEDVRVRFRAEFFNAFNHTQFRVAGADLQIFRPGFGQATSARSPRNVQLALRVEF